MLSRFRRGLASRDRSADLTIRTVMKFLLPFHDFRHESQSRRCLARSTDRGRSRKLLSSRCLGAGLRRRIVAWWGGVSAAFAGVRIKEVARTRVGVRWVARPRRIHAAGCWLVWGWVRGLRCCCRAAASMRLDHRRSDVAHTRPHRAGCPVAGPAVAVSIHVRPVRAAGALQSPAASCRLGSRCELPHGPAPIHAADLQCRMGTACAARLRRWRSLARAAPIGAGRATPGR